MNRNGEDGKEKMLACVFAAIWPTSKLNPINRMSLFSAINDLITEHGSAAIMRERLALIREQAQALEKQVAELQGENTNLKRRVAELNAQVLTKTELDEFVECRGALFKRKPGGGYHNAVFCPDCQKPMSSLMGDLPYNCHKCHRSVDFTGNDLPNVMREL